MAIVNIGLVAVLTISAAILTILEYFKYLPEIVTIIKNPKSLLNIHRGVVKTFYFKNFWKPFLKGNDVVIVLSEGDIDDRRDTSVKDNQGVTKLLNKLNENFRWLNFDGSVPANEFVAGTYNKHNIISVAGPIPNRITNELLYNNDCQEIRYKFDKLNTGKITNTIMSSQSDFRLSPDTYYDEQKDEELIDRDFGIITKAKSPYNQNQDIINVAGGFGEGTLAGFLILSDPEKLKKLKKEGGKYFQALYTVPVDENGHIMEPRFIQEFEEGVDSAVVQLESTTVN